MSQLMSNCQNFERIVGKYFGFLEQYGFKRSREHDHLSPVLCVISYAGKYVIIEIYLDVRDGYVGVSLRRKTDDYWIDFSNYLSKLGVLRLPPVPQLSSPIESALAGWADALKLHGKKILQDSIDSLDIYR